MIGSLGYGGRPCASPVELEALAAGRKKAQGPEARLKSAATRRQRGYHPPAARSDWIGEDDTFLGTMPDAEVARRTGRTALAVSLRRCRLGIPPHGRGG
jgi:hypothetical protein